MLIQGTKFDFYHIHVYSSRNVKFDSDNSSILAHNCTYKLENRNKFVYYAKTEFRAQFTCSNLLTFYLFLFMSGSFGAFYLNLLFKKKARDQHGVVEILVAPHFM